MSYSKTVASILAEKGWQCFDINADTANGPDLTIAKNGKTYRVEIKVACKSTRAWKTTPIGKSGKTCDLVAIILPNKSLLLQPMSEHLKHCSKNGSRSITTLVEINL